MLQIGGSAVRVVGNGLDPARRNLPGIAVQGGERFLGPVEGAHAPRQGLQLSQDGAAPRLMRSGDAAHLVEQPLVRTAERVSERSDEPVLLGGELVHADTHGLDLLDQSGHCRRSLQFAPDA